MRTTVDALLRQQSEQFSLRFTCEHCVHAQQDKRCSLGYPSEAHRDVDLEALQYLEFCKYFELY
ncbi:MAG TPA: hypothetical protein VL137_04750 [Polyangiaceae bacterium]|jgi:hypothetical protein|nr:hypothetical protein [Polyangiaceae bacterium]